MWSTDSRDVGRADCGRGRWKASSATSWETGDSGLAITACSRSKAAAEARASVTSVPSFRGISHWRNRSSRTAFAVARATSCGASTAGGG